MKASLRWLALASAMFATASVHAEKITLFDGKTLSGWEGSTHWWWVEDGAITGGSRKEMVPQNEFLATREKFDDFELTLKIKITGTEGFVNSGIQIRSHREPGSSEMVGYQVDAGDEWWGLLYDESRRNEVIARAKNLATVVAAVRNNDWNEYRIRAEGPRIRTWINGVVALDYVEKDKAIDQSGVIGVQVHGDGKTIVQVKDIVIEKLSVTK